jgi:hypothetical protein
VRSTPQEDITIQPPRFNQQTIAITLWNNSVTVCKPYSETTVGNDLVEG